MQANTNPKRAALRFNARGEITIPFFQVGVPAYSDQELKDLIDAMQVVGS